MTTFKDTLEKAARESANSREFKIYQEVREVVLSMLGYVSPEFAPSEYWKQELAGSFYVLDASPLVVESLRQHTYNITGLSDYHYRAHHAFKMGPYVEKLKALRAIDTRGLSVSESPKMGGFGHKIDGKMFNLDTLKFYEYLIGLDRADFIEPIVQSEGPVVMEIGSGWGGFAYQFKTLFPHAAYVLVDLPQILLYSATYLKVLFPDARVYMGDGSPESYKNIDFSKYDFVFIPHYAWGVLQPQRVDLALNMISFQEMTDAQMIGYIDQLAAWKVSRVYSLNRDISPNNPELSGVTSILSRKYKVEDVAVLPVPYHTLKFPKVTLQVQIKQFIKWVFNLKARRMTREYRHLRATLD